MQIWFEYGIAKYATVNQLTVWDKTLAIDVLISTGITLMKELHSKVLDVKKHAYIFTLYLYFLFLLDSPILIKILCNNN